MRACFHWNFQISAIACLPAPLPSAPSLQTFLGSWGDPSGLVRHTASPVFTVYLSCACTHTYIEEQIVSLVNWCCSFLFSSWSAVNLRLRDIFTINKMGQTHMRSWRKHCSVRPRKWEYTEIHRLLFLWLVTNSSCNQLHLICKSRER